MLETKGEYINKYIRVADWMVIALTSQSMQSRIMLRVVVTVSDHWS